MPRSFFAWHEHRPNGFNGTGIIGMLDLKRAQAIK